MSVWLPAGPEGTKDHREPSAQRGTDMSLSLLIPTLQSSVRNTLSAAVPAARRLAAKSSSSWRPCADAAVGGTNTVQ